MLYILIVIIITLQVVSLASLGGLANIIVKQPIVKSLSTDINDYRYRLDPLLAEDQLFLEKVEDNNSLEALIGFLKNRAIVQVDFNKIPVDNLLKLADHVLNDIHLFNQAKLDNKKQENDEFSENDFDSLTNSTNLKN